jgi:hypothetical protein
MRLITELFEDIQFKLDEAAGGKKNYYIEGIFMQADVANRNKRIYPKSVMESALSKFQPLIESKRALGELGHPAGPSINLDRASHLINELKWDGNNIVGRAKILDTPNGNIAKNLIDEGVKLGVSSRALGSVKTLKDGINEVQGDLMISTVDIVADPSAPDAFVQGLYEGKEWIFDNGIWKTIDAEAARTMVTEAKTGVQLHEAKVKAFQLFIERLK